MIGPRLRLPAASNVIRVLALACIVPAVLSAQGVTGSVTVDFAAVQHVNSASGLLYGTTTTTAADRLAPLRPRFWRYTDFHWPQPISPSTIFYRRVDLARHFYSIVPDVETQLMLSTYYGFPVDNWPNGAPWLNWTGYETHLRGVVRRLRDDHLPDTFEVWNEPDIPMFWNGTRAQFHELYLRAYRVIRAEMGPDVTVAGPTLGTYIHADVEAFLEFCLANGCEVNDLTYHTLDDSPPGIAAIAADARDARASFLENPRYAPLKIRRIVINEIVGPRYTHQPAGTLTHYAEFEAGGADLGGRSTWIDSAGTPEGFNGTLAGLLTAGSLQPRSVWWAHKLYADGVATRVASSVSGPHIVALASRASDTEFPQVLVGHVDFVQVVHQGAGLVERTACFEQHHLDAAVQRGPEGERAHRVDSGYRRGGLVSTLAALDHSRERLRRHGPDHAAADRGRRRAQGHADPAGRWLPRSAPGLPGERHRQHGVDAVDEAHDRSRCDRISPRGGSDAEQLRAGFDSSRRRDDVRVVRAAGQLLRATPRNQRCRAEPPDTGHAPGCRVRLAAWNPHRLARVGRRRIGDLELESGIRQRRALYSRSWLRPRPQQRRDGRYFRRLRSSAQSRLREHISSAFALATPAARARPPPRSSSSWGPPRHCQDHRAHLSQRCPARTSRWRGPRPPVATHRPAMSWRRAPHGVNRTWRGFNWVR